MAAVDPAKSASAIWRAFRMCEHAQPGYCSRSKHISAAVKRSDLAMSGPGLDAGFSDYILREIFVEKHDHPIDPAKMRGREISLRQFSC
jgi:hypothetical protein